MIIANPLTLEEIKQIERNLFRIYDKLSPFAKKTIQKIISKQNQDVISNVNSTSINTSDSNSESDNETTNTSNSVVTTSTESNVKNSGNITQSSSKINLKQMLSLFLKHQHQLLQQLAQRLKLLLLLKILRNQIAKVSKLILNLIKKKLKIGLNI
jgi:hypothetical protein